MTGRVYMADSGLIAIGATGATPALYVSTPATADLTIIRAVPSIEANTGTPTVPSNSSVFWSLNLVTGTQGGGASVTPRQVQGNALAARSTWESGSTALTGLTQSTEIWPYTIPFAMGAFKDDEQVNTNALEIPMAISLEWCFYFNIPAGPGFGANCFARICAWFIE